MNTVSILQQARDMITDPAKHTKEVFCTHDNAVCGVGAILRACGQRVDALGDSGDIDLTAADVRAAGHALARAAGWTPHDTVVVSGIGEQPVAWFSHLFAFNDTVTHPFVLAAFDTAISNETARMQEFTAEPAARTPVLR